MREVGYSLRVYLTHRVALCSIAPLNECRISGSAERPNWNPMSEMVGWDRGADRASNDADVSSIPPIIPYGGVSPVRLEGRRIRRDLPGASISLSLLPACASRRPVCLHPSCTSEALLKCSEVYRFLFHTSCVPENANLRNVVCLLRTRGKRPSRRRTTEKRDELAAGASIT